VAGSFGWKDPATAPAVADSQKTEYDVVFTPADGKYDKVECKVKLTVNKAANPARVSSTAIVKQGGKTTDLADSVKKYDATGKVSYAISGDAKGCSLNGSVLTSGDSTGTVTVYVSVAEDDNYTALAATPIIVTITDKNIQTITAADVTATYGDTGRRVSAATSGDGRLSYAVKSGDAVTVDADSGELTIRKVGTAIVIVTAAETKTYAQVFKEVTVTIREKVEGPGTIKNSPSHSRL
jgi:hypothetical protein